MCSKILYRLLKIQRRIYVAMMAVCPFNSYNWRFFTENFIDLESKIENEDRKEFEIMNLFDYNEYFSSCILGARKYLLKEKDEDIPKHQSLHTR